MSFDPNIVNYLGLAIGLVFGAVGLLSGFCLLSSLRGWWGSGDGRLVRTYALAIAVAIVATQVLALYDYVDLGKSIYLQPSFSAPLMFFGGLLFGYGMVLANGCASRALVLLGRGNLRSFVVLVTLGIVGRLALWWWVAQIADEQVDAVLDFLDTYQRPALIISIVLTVLVIGVNLRRGRDFRLD